MTAQIIEKDGTPVFAVIPYEEYLALVARVEEAADEAVFDAWQQAPGETVPAEIVNRLLTGENPVRVWRTHRGMTPEDIAAQIGIEASHVRDLEEGRSVPSLKTLQMIANVLAVDIEDLLPADDV